MERTNTDSQTSETPEEPTTPTETVTSTTVASETQTTPTQPDDTSRELERLKASLKRANAEAKAERERAAELAKFKEQTEAEKLSTEQKQELARTTLEKRVADLQKQYDDALQSAKAYRTSTEIRLQAASMGVKPALLDKVTRLIAPSELEYADTGEPTNHKELLAALIKDMPELLTQPAKSPAPTSGGATNPARSSTNGTVQLSWESITKMAREAPEEYQRRRAEIQNFMARNPVR